MSFKLDSKLLNFDKIAKKETTDGLTEQVDTLDDRVSQLEDSDVFVLAESSGATTKTKHTQTSSSYETKTESTASGEYLSVTQDAGATLTIHGKSKIPFSRTYDGVLENTTGTNNHMSIGSFSGRFSSCAYDSKGLSGANISVSAWEGIKIKNTTGKQFLIENDNDRNRKVYAPSILINGRKGDTKLQASNEDSDYTRFYSSCVVAGMYGSHLVTYGKSHGGAKNSKEILSSVKSNRDGLQLYTKNGTVEMAVTGNPTATINSIDYKVPLVPVSGIEEITIHTALYEDERNYQWAQIPGPGLYVEAVPVTVNKFNVCYNYVLIDIPNLNVNTRSIGGAPQFDYGHDYDYNYLDGEVYMIYTTSHELSRSDTADIYEPPRVIEHVILFENNTTEASRIDAGRLFRILKY